MPKQMTPAEILSNARYVAAAILADVVSRPQLFARRRNRSETHAWDGTFVDLHEFVDANDYLQEMMDLPRNRAFFAGDWGERIEAHAALGAIEDKVDELLDERRRRVPGRAPLERGVIALHDIAYSSTPWRPYNGFRIEAPGHRMSLYRGDGGTYDNTRLYAYVWRRPDGRFGAKVDDLEPGTVNDYDVGVFDSQREARHEAREALINFFHQSYAR